MLNMEKFLRKKNMQTSDFAKIIGCSRQVIWKVKKRIPVSHRIAQKILEATKGEVYANIKKRKRQK